MAGLGPQLPQNSDRALATPAPTADISQVRLRIPLDHETPLPSMEELRRRGYSEIQVVTILHAEAEIQLLLRVKDRIKKRKNLPSMSDALESALERCRKDEDLEQENLFPEHLKEIRIGLFVSFGAEGCPLGDDCTGGFPYDGDADLCNIDKCLMIKLLKEKRIKVLENNIHGAIPMMSIDKWLDNDRRIMLPIPGLYTECKNKHRDPTPTKLSDWDILDCGFAAFHEITSGFCFRCAYDEGLIRELYIKNLRETQNLH